MTSIIFGVVEIFTAELLGIALDIVLETGLEKLFAKQGIFLLGTFVFILIDRPIFFDISAYAESVIVAPNPRKLIATPLHRGTLGHSTGFFENDFAGRIAQK